MIRVEREFGLVFLLRTQPVKALHFGATEGAVLPFAGGAPRELGGLWRALQRFARSQQCRYIDAVVDNRLSHVQPP
jgi:hypothetical protein